MANSRSDLFWNISKFLIVYDIFILIFVLHFSINGVSLLKITWSNMNNENFSKWIFDLCY